MPVTEKWLSRKASQFDKNIRRIFLDSSASESPKGRTQERELNLVSRSNKNPMSPQVAADFLLWGVPVQEKWLSRKARQYERTQ